MLDSIKKNLSIILTTQKGTVPLNPNFGINRAAYMDRSLASVDLIKLRDEIAEQISMYEPRVPLDSIQVRVERNGEILVDVNSSTFSTGMVNGQ